MTINNVNRPQSQPLATDVSSGNPTRGATPKGTPVEVQTPKPQTGFLAKMKAGLSSLGSSISAGFKSLTRGSAHSAPPRPARATTAAQNEQAKVAGQAKDCCVSLLHSVSTPSLTGLPVVNKLAMAEGSLILLLKLPQATRESSMQSLVKGMSDAELSRAAEGLSQLRASLASLPPGSTRAERQESLHQRTLTTTLSTIVQQEQRSRALTPDNFRALANMVADGKKITVGQLIALPETHPARALFSAFSAREFTGENFNFCKSMAAVLAQTDPKTQDAMIWDIALNMNLDGVNTDNHVALNTAFSLAQETNDYLACLPELNIANANAAKMANTDTMARFSKVLANDLNTLAPRAHQSDLVAFSGSQFSGDEGVALTATINNTMASNPAAVPLSMLRGGRTLIDSTSTPSAGAAQGYSQALAQVIGGLGPNARGMEETLFQAMSAGVPRREIESNISLAVKNSAISQREADALLSLIPAWNGRAAKSPVTAFGSAGVTEKSASSGASTTASESASASASTPALSPKFQPLTGLQFMYRDEHVNGLVSINKERARAVAPDVVFMPPVSSLESANLVEIFKAGTQERFGTNFKIAVPIHTGHQDGGHWTGAFVEVNTDNKTVTIRGVDSLNPQLLISPDILNALTGMFSDSVFFPDFEISVSAAQPAYLQGNTLSCGPCTMENLLYLATGAERPGPAQSTDMAALRQRQAELLQAAG